jgi:formylglycine-generating enzyme required for sulfatase activity
LLGYDGVGATDKGNPVTVSPFRLDRFEASVGRFRSFVADYDAWRAAGHPAADEGAQPGVPGSGWDSAWNNDLPADSVGLTANAYCWYGSTWTDQPQGNEAFPEDCVSWFEAFAFCAWDDARLPTRAEWSFATSGGSDQRVYPWSTPAASTALDDSLAVFCGGSCQEKAVGSTSPLGDGRYGQADLAGSVWEWGRDVVADKRPIFGGSVLTDASYLNATGVYSDLATSRGTNGIRCARAF